MENFNNQEKIKTNKELINEIKIECPKFEIFWNKILEQSRLNKGEIRIDNPSPLKVYRFIASKMNTIKINQETYVNEKSIPIEFYSDNMKMLQETMAIAANIYYEGSEILDLDGKIRI